MPTKMYAWQEVIYAISCISIWKLQYKLDITGYHSVHMDVTENIHWLLICFFLIWIKPISMYTMVDVRLNAGTSYILQFEHTEHKFQSTFIWNSILGKMSLICLTWLEGQSSYFIFYILICHESYFISEITCDVHLLPCQFGILITSW